MGILGLIVSLPLNYLLAQYMENPEPYYALKTEGLYYTIVYALGVFPLAMVYLIALALTFEIKWLRKILLVISPVGKTAFSNYVLQNLVGIITFYGIGFGLMQQFGPLALTVFAVLVFILQIIISTIWLKYFRFGPIEWAWRSLTYRKVQLMRNAGAINKEKI